MNQSRVQGLRPTESSRAHGDTNRITNPTIYPPEPPAYARQSFQATSLPGLYSAPPGVLVDPPHLSTFGPRLQQASSQEPILQSRASFVGLPDRSMLRATAAHHPNRPILPKCSPGGQGHDRPRYRRSEAGGSVGLAPLLVDAVKESAFEEYKRSCRDRAQNFALNTRFDDLYNAGFRYLTGHLVGGAMRCTPEQLAIGAWLVVHGIVTVFGPDIGTTNRSVILQACRSLMRGLPSGSISQEHPLPMANQSVQAHYSCEPWLGTHSHATIVQSGQPPDSMLVCIVVRFLLVIQELQSRTLKPGLYYATTTYDTPTPYETLTLNIVRALGVPTGCQSHPMQDSLQAIGEWISKGSPKTPEVELRLFMVGEKFLSEKPHLLARFCVNVIKVCKDVDLGMDQVVLHPLKPADFALSLGITTVASWVTHMVNLMTTSRVRSAPSMLQDENSHGRSGNQGRLQSGPSSNFPSTLAATSPPPTRSGSESRSFRSCHLCDRTYTGRYAVGNLNRHLKNDHGGVDPVDLHCDDCGKNFRRTDNLGKHQKVCRARDLAGPSSD